MIMMDGHSFSYRPQVISKMPKLWYIFVVKENICMLYLTEKITNDASTNAYSQINNFMVTTSLCNMIWMRKRWLWRGFFFLGGRRYVGQWGKNLKLQWTLPKSNSHKSNNRLSRRSIQVLFLYSIVFNPSEVNFFLSRSYFFSPNRFELGRVDCTCIWS